MSRSKSSSKNILFGFSNIASMLDNTMCMLEKTGNYNLRGIAVNPSKYHSFNHPNWKKFIYKTDLNILRKLFQSLKADLQLIKGILWADQIVFIFAIKGYTRFNLYLWVLKTLSKRKQIFIEWAGDDVRFPELALKLNPYYYHIFEKTKAYITKETSFANQALAKKLGAITIGSPEMSLFFHPKYVSEYYYLFQRLDLTDFKAQYPALDNTVPKLVHTPSNPAVKGTYHLREIIENLKAKGLQFEYIEITNKTRTQALQAIGQSDIFIDQFYGGGYGMACCEAMAMGKPTCVYLMPAAYERMPQDIPLINCSIDTLEQSLEELISSPRARHEAGKASRAFMDKYYAADSMTEAIVSLLDGKAQAIPNTNNPADFK